jgi:hypothetical protein
LVDTQILNTVTEYIKDLEDRWWKLKNLMMYI